MPGERAELVEKISNQTISFPHFNQTIDKQNSTII